jgi:hypothetical protein
MNYISPEFYPTLGPATVRKVYIFPFKPSMKIRLTLSTIFSFDLDIELEGA